MPEVIDIKKLVYKLLEFIRPGEGVECIIRLLHILEWKTWQDSWYIKNKHPLFLDKQARMKIRLKIVVALLIAGFTAAGFMHQEKAAKFVQFNNFSASYEVPAGKTWVVNQIFTSFTNEVKSNPDGTSNPVAIRIFIKTLNGDIKTDFEGNRFGPQVFQSNNTAATISYPIVLPEKTTFSLVMVKGDPGACTMFDGTGYMSYYEVTNDVQP